MEGNLRPPVQCSEDTESNEDAGSRDAASFQTGQEYSPSLNIGAAAAAAQDLATDAERFDRPSGIRKDQSSPEMKPSTDKIVVTGKKGGEIVATGLAGALKPGTLFQIGHTNYTHVYNKGPPSGSDREGQKANISNMQPIITSKEAPSPKHLDAICTGLAGDWRRLGRAFGFSDALLDQTQMDHRYDGQHEVNYRVMLKWKQQSSEPTLNKLAQILCDIGRGDLADLLHDVK